MISITSRLLIIILLPSLLGASEPQQPQQTEPQQQEQKKKKSWLWAIPAVGGIAGFALFLASRGGGRNGGGSMPRPPRPGNDGGGAPRRGPDSGPSGKEEKPKAVEDRSRFVLEHDGESGDEDEDGDHSAQEGDDEQHSQNDGIGPFKIKVTSADGASEGLTVFNGLLLRPRTTSSSVDMPKPAEHVQAPLLKRPAGISAGKVTDRLLNGSLSLAPAATPTMSSEQHHGHDDLKPYHDLEEAFERELNAAATLSPEQLTRCEVLTRKLMAGPLTQASKEDLIALYKIVGMSEAEATKEADAAIQKAKDQDAMAAHHLQAPSARPAAGSAALAAPHSHAHWTDTVSQADVDRACATYIKGLRERCRHMRPDDCWYPLPEDSQRQQQNSWRGPVLPPAAAAAAPHDSLDRELDLQVSGAAPLNMSRLLAAPASAADEAGDQARKASVRASLGRSRRMSPASSARLPQNDDERERRIAARAEEIMAEVNAEIDSRSSSATPAPAGDSAASALARGQAPD